MGKVVALKKLKPFDTHLNKSLFPQLFLKKLNLQTSSNSIQEHYKMCIKRFLSNNYFVSHTSAKLYKKQEKENYNLKFSKTNKRLSKFFTLTFFPWRTISKPSEINFSAIHSVPFGNFSSQLRFFIWNEVSV